MITLLKPLIIVLFSFIFGYFFGQYYDKKFTGKDKFRASLQKVALLALNPLAFLGAMWIAPVTDIRIITLPVVGAVALISGGLFTLLYCKFRKIDRISTGSLIPVGSFTNIGSVGGIIVFFFLGEEGFSFVPIYKLFEELVYYGIWFPIIKSFSNIESKQKNRLKLIFKDPFILSMLIAITIGVVLNISGLKRPEIISSINPFLITGSTIFLLVSIGMGFKFRKVSLFIPHALAVTFIKTVLVPTITIPTAYFLGLGQVQGGLVLKVAIILSVMPAAFLSIVPSTIYKLDTDLSNTAWLGTLFSLLYTLPILALIL